MEKYITTCDIAPNLHQDQTSRFNLINNLEKIQGMELSTNCARGYNSRIQTLGNYGTHILFYPTKMYKKESDSLYIMR